MASMSDALSSLYSESRSLWVPEKVQEYTCGGDALTFLRDHVGPSMPCVWRGAASDWPAVKQWAASDFRYLREKIGDKEVEVAVTPDGRADAVLEVETSDGVGSKVFALPDQVHQPFQCLLDSLEDVPACHAALDDCDKEECGTLGSGSVPYYSAQDGSLTREVPELLDDVDVGTIEFARTAFGAQPSAVNLWVGDGRSVTTMHADPYENVYAVVAGRKMFELRPPCDAAFLPKPVLKTVRWSPAEGTGGIEKEMEGLRPKKKFFGWRVIEDSGETAWIDEELIAAEWGSAVSVVLNPGDLLYLPGLWCTYCVVLLYWAKLLCTFEAALFIFVVVI